MYYYLVSALKRRLISEFKDSFSQHPVYDKAAPYIQNRFSFDERPQFAMVVKGSSGNQVVLAADNLIGTVVSHVMLGFVDKPCYPIEWVRDDTALLKQNGNVMPTIAGIYYLEVLTVPTNVSEVGTFALDPLLTVVNEQVLTFHSGIEHEGQLQNAPAPGTVRLYENMRYMLVEGLDYQVDATGKITFLIRFSQGSSVSADYRYATPSVGPIDFQWNTADFKTLPGVVLAFGKRAKVGDKVAIMVTPDLQDTALAYGGKFEVSFDVDVITRDTTQTEEMADLAVMYLLEKKARLEYEGIELLEISIGGEAEESADENADLNYYNASLSIRLRADWEIHIPLPLTIARVTTDPKGDSAQNFDRRTSYTSLISGNTGNRLYFATNPILPGRNNSYERIG